MKQVQIIIVTGALAFLPPALLSAATGAHSGVAHDSKVHTNNGKKWETDGPLRQGMESINKLVKESGSAVHSGQASDEAYKKLGQALKKQTDFIFKNCKLGPAADQELHKILAPILRAEKILSSEAKSASKHDAFGSVLGALRLYGAHFDHHGWIGPE